MHLPNAPIKEALIDIKTRGISLLGQMPPHIEEQLKFQYPDIEQLRSKSVEVHVSETHELTSKSEDRYEGIRAFSIDRLQVVQFRRDGFTFSRLAPYEDWAALRKEACRLWKIYTEWAKPEMVSRIAVRYINQISIELPMRDFNDYLAIPPYLPPGLPQGLASFLMRFVIPNPSNGAIAIITQSLEAPTDTHVQVILDIDVFKDVELPINGDECWSQFDALRDYKNEIFFQSITERTKEMYK